MNRKPILKAYAKEIGMILDVLDMSWAYKRNPIILWDEETDASWSLYDDEVEFMSYIGLTDKNGMDMYEGYLVRSDDWNPDTYEIRFVDGEFVLWNDLLGEGYHVSIHYVSTEFEFCGTIYDTMMHEIKDKENV